MNEPESVFDLRTPWGAPRFYPPGSHPAAAQMRENLRALRKVEEETGEPSQSLLAAIKYVETSIAMFEEGESIAKYEAWRRLQRR